jgi:hypothetical protein
MRWNLRMKAAEAGVWKSTEMRRRLADSGLVICSVLGCSPSDLLIPEPEKVTERKPKKVAKATGNSPRKPTLGRRRSLPPA